MPYAFTEHGVLILSSVLNSEKAIQVNIQIMRIYSRMRELMFTHKDILLKLEQMEKQTSKNSKEIAQIFEALKRLLHKPEEERKRVGYKS